MSGNLKINSDYAKLYFRENTANKDNSCNTVSNSLTAFMPESAKVLYENIDFQYKPKEETKEQKIRKYFEQVKAEQGWIGKSWDWTKNKFDMKTGSDSVNEALKAFEQGKIGEKEIINRILAYEEGQKEVVDITSDIASGAAALGTYAVCVVTAPVTGGGSIAAATFMAAQAGIIAKVGVKEIDSATGNRYYPGKEELKDIALGAANGIIAPLTGGCGGVAGKAVAQRVGLKAVSSNPKLIAGVVGKTTANEAKEIGKKALAKTVKDTALTAANNPFGYKYIGESALKKTLAYGTEFAVDGSLGGALYSGTSTAIEGGSIKDIASSTVKGAAVGAVLAPVAGLGIKTVGKSMETAGRAIYKTGLKRAASIGLTDVLKKGQIGEKSFKTLVEVLNSKEGGVDLPKAIYEDIATLKAGKSLLPEFKKGTSLIEAFNGSKAGDAVQIGEKMYINDGFKLIPWQMTKEKFLELFPPVERYIMKQGYLGDCYFVSALDACMLNPCARARLYQSFKLDGNDVLCTIRAYKDYKGTTRFTDGKIDLFKDKHLKGCKGLQMIEQSYANCALRETSGIPKALNARKDINALMERLRGGKASNVFNELLGIEFPLDLYGTKTGTYEHFRIPSCYEGEYSVSVSKPHIEHFKKLLGDFINEKGEFPRHLVCFGTPDKVNKELVKDFMKYYVTAHHSHAITGYDPVRQVVKMINPWNGAKEIEVPIEIIYKHMESLYVGKMF